MTSPDLRRPTSVPGSPSPGPPSPDGGVSRPPSPDAGAFAWRLGQVATTALGIVLVAWALTVDFPKSTGGFFGDASTYYSLAHSLAEDFDFEYRRDDLVRVWREFPSGPEGLFLKRGRDVQGVSGSASFPFVALSTTTDADSGRLYYGKGFIYPLFAAPWVWLFGTNGFLVLHALLMTLCFACAYGFLVARSSPIASLIFATAFLLASVAPVYMVWLQPDFFNLAMVLIGYFFWCYKEAVAESTTACIGQVRARWLMTPRSDLVAALLLGIATFSKPVNILLIAPPLILCAYRRQWRRGVTVGALFGLVVAGLFAVNIAITGEWNYQGGEERATFYGMDPDGAGPRLGGFPFQTEQHTFDTTGIQRETNRVPLEVLTSDNALLQVFRRNLGYFFFGRHTGFIPYFFPGAVAIVLFLAARRRPLWQWLTLGAGLASAIGLLLYMPYTYSGGGGPVGNRYFLGVYPAFLFVTPPLAGAVAPLVALAGSAVFTAQLITNPFVTSSRPSEHVKAGPYRWLPPEMTLLNDLPMNVTPDKVRQPLGGAPPVQAYFLDDNAYPREGPAFWVRGRSRAEFMLRAPIVLQPGDRGEVVRQLRIPRAEILLETGAEANRVTISTGAETQTVEIPANDRRTITIALPAGVPYHPDPAYPMNFVYLMSITSESGFIPMFWSGGRDARLLGVFVHLSPLYE
ncbi:MAG TPA: hypothetical protein VNJ02_11880 [Vicinamibacterales bacterium]|nr:hypothetical protein [Vicinamibacterales bacterium]